MLESQVQEMEVYVSGVSTGRDAALRALASGGFKITKIKDQTPIPHNGCRAKKPRRV
jgi:small subunit ribosomal protein S11